MQRTGGSYVRDKEGKVTLVHSTEPPRPEPEKQPEPEETLEEVISNEDAE